VRRLDSRPRAQAQHSPKDRKILKDDKKALKDTKKMKTIATDDVEMPLTVSGSKTCLTVIRTSLAAIRTTIIRTTMGGMKRQDLEAGWSEMQDSSWRPSSLGLPCFPLVSFWSVRGKLLS
jgi:hypothetical protein